MTRLTEDWIINMETEMKDYERSLLEKTGMTLTALAAAASDVPIDKLALLAENTRVGVIPFTSGLGVIGSFSESVAAICSSLDFNAFVTKATDADGLYEACRHGAEILFMADDNRFIALNIKTGVMAENSRATALGFVEALRGAAISLADQQVLVIGCGVVGQEALFRLLAMGANPVVFDHNPKVLKDMADRGYEVIADAGQIAAYPLVYDATSEGGWLTAAMLHPDVMIAAPGVPLSLNQEAFERYQDRLIHDCLPIGVATMLAMACK